MEQTAGAGLGLLIGIVILVLVGAVVGWAASWIVKGDGSGFWFDVLVGIGGSILAGLSLPMLGVDIGGGIVASFIAAVIGAVFLLLIVRLVRR